MLEVVIGTVKEMCIGATECGPECSIQTLNEIRKRMNITGKHMENRNLIVSAICLEKIVAFKEAIIRWGCGIAVGYRMSESAEEAGKCQLGGHSTRATDGTV